MSEVLLAALKRSNRASENSTQSSKKVETDRLHSNHGTTLNRTPSSISQSTASEAESGECYEITSSQIPKTNENWHNDNRKHDSTQETCVEFSTTGHDSAGRLAMRFLDVAVPLDTLKEHVDRLGGIDVVTREKRWCEVARSLGLDTARHTSASTRLRIGLESYAARTASGGGKRIKAGSHDKKKGRQGSDLRGVIRRNGGGWHARLYVPLSLRTPGLPMRIFLGPCKSREEAALRCDNKLIQLFGRARAYRYLNFPDLAAASGSGDDTALKKQRVRAREEARTWVSSEPLVRVERKPSKQPATEKEPIQNQWESTDEDSSDDDGSDAFETQDALLAVWKSATSAPATDSAVMGVEAPTNGQHSPSGDAFDRDSPAGQWTGRLATGLFDPQSSEARSQATGQEALSFASNALALGFR